jgi:hypothetical protein
MTLRTCLTQHHKRPGRGRSPLSSTPSERFLRFPASGIAWTSLLSPASEALREDLLKQFVNLNIVLIDLVYDVPSELPDVFPRRLAPYGGISKAVRFVGQPSPPGLRRERSGAPGVAKTEAVASEWSAPARVQQTRAAHWPHWSTHAHTRLASQS